MASTHAIERNRGIKESRQQLAALREKWPAAFPAKRQEVRPLSIGAAGEISAVMGWQLPYTLGVLDAWKMGHPYCQAVLRYNQRIGLDGTPAEAVDGKAKELAAKRLSDLAKRTPKKALETTAPAATEPQSAQASPTETPEQLRARVRASLLRRSA